MHSAWEGWSQSFLEKGQPPASAAAGAAIFILSQEDEHSEAQEAGSAAAGAAILSQADLQESEQLLEQASTAPGAASPPQEPQHEASAAPGAESPQDPQQLEEVWQPAKRPMAARAMMEKNFIGLSFPKSEERNMDPPRV